MDFHKVCIQCIFNNDYFIGAAISLLTGLTYSNHSLNAIIAASGYTLLRWMKVENPNHVVIHEKQQHVPVYCYHGRVDEVVPCHYALQCYEELKKLGVNNLRINVDEDQGHWVTEEEIAEWAAIMRKVE